MPCRPSPCGPNSQCREINLNANNDFKVKVIGLSNGIYFITSPSAEQNIERKIIVNH